jgi:phosphoribosylanthranilate isomerase
LILTLQLLPSYTDLLLFSPFNSMQPKIKICGITDIGDAELAEFCGADFIGLVCEIGYSPRCISRGAAAELARRSRLPVVLLLDKPVREAIEISTQVRPFALQLIGRHSPEELELLKKETPCGIWLPVRIPARAPQEETQSGSCRRYLDGISSSLCDTIILDTLVSGMQGGTGRICDWGLAEKIAAASTVPVFLAGGITAENAARACSLVRPAGIDVSSGVEKSPGVKDPAKVEKLIREIRSLKIQ